MKGMYVLIALLSMHLLGFSQEDSILNVGDSPKPVTKEFMLAGGLIYPAKSVYGQFYNQFDPGIDLMAEYTRTRGMFGIGLNLSFSQSGLLNAAKFSSIIDPNFREMLVIPRKHIYSVGIVNRVSGDFIKKTKVSLLLEIGYSRQIITETAYIEYYVAFNTSKRLDYSRIKSNGGMLGYGFEWKIPVSGRMNLLVFAKQQFSFGMGKYILTQSTGATEEIAMNVTKNFLAGLGVYYQLNL